MIVQNKAIKINEAQIERIHYLIYASDSICRLLTTLFNFIYLQEYEYASYIVCNIESRIMHHNLDAARVSDEIIHKERWSARVSRILRLDRH